MKGPPPCRSPRGDPRTVCLPSCLGRQMFFVKPDFLVLDTQSSSNRYCVAFWLPIVFFSPASLFLSIPNPWFAFPSPSAEKCPDWFPGTLKEICHCSAWSYPKYKTLPTVLDSKAVYGDLWSSYGILERTKLSPCHWKHVPLETWFGKTHSGTSDQKCCITEYAIFACSFKVVSSNSSSISAVACMTNCLPFRSLRAMAMIPLKYYPHDSSEVTIWGHYHSHMTISNT